MQLSKGERDKKLIEILELSPIDTEEAINNLSNETGIKVNLLKEELEYHKKIVEAINKKKRTQKKEAGKLMTEKEFSFLKINANSKNERLQNLIEEGLDYINLNDMERAYAKTFLKSIQRSQPSSLQFDVSQAVALRDEDKASELIANKIITDYYIYSTKDDLKSEMWIYSDGIYKPNGESQIKEVCREIFGEAYTPQRTNKVIAKVQADTFIESDIFFKKEQDNLEEMPVKNGVLNIFTREIKPFNPQKIFFNKLPIAYEPEKECPTIKKFFADILKSEDDSKVMFELFGYALLKEYRFEKAFMFIGGGRNGKGKTLGLFKRFLGAENCCSVPLSQMRPDSTSVCELFGRLINVAGDLSNDDLKSTGMFKQLCGRDLINAKRKFLRDLIFVNYSKLCFACNDLPRVYDFSEGFWTRWILLEFPYKFVPKEDYEKAEIKANLKIEDTQIIEKLTTPKELSGLLNEALNGLKRLLDNQDFSYTKGTAEVKEFWIRKSDSFTAFCMDCLEENSESYISKKELRKRFNQYCKIHKIKGTSDKSIKVTLEDLFGVIEGRKGSYDNQEFVWQGIDFKISKVSGGILESIGNGNLHISQNMVTNLTNLESNPEQDLLQALTILQQDTGQLIPLDKIQQLPFDNVQALLTKLEKSGEIYQPKPDFYSLI